MAEDTQKGRKLLPTRRHSWTQKVRVGGQSVFLTMGEYEDGSLGEIFLSVSRRGTALRALFETIAILFSQALQYGCPLETLLDNFSIDFPPSGIVEGCEDISEAESVLDFVGKLLRRIYLSGTREKVAGVFQHGRER